MSDIILFHEYGTQLRLGDEDTLILNVMCGRILQYGVEFALNDSEREAYKRQGDPYIKSLAEKVRGGPQAFVPRGRTC